MDNVDVYLCAEDISAKFDWYLKVYLELADPPTAKEYEKYAILKIREMIRTRIERFAPIYMHNMYEGKITFLSLDVDAYDYLHKVHNISIKHLEFRSNMWQEMHMANLMDANSFWSKHYTTYYVDMKDYEDYDDEDYGDDENGLPLPFELMKMIDAASAKMHVDDSIVKSIEAICAKNTHSVVNFSTYDIYSDPNFPISLVSFVSRPENSHYKIELDDEISSISLLVERRPIQAPKRQPIQVPKRQ
jgi:hypothetical protein